MQLPIAVAIIKLAVKRTTLPKFNVARVDAPKAHRQGSWKPRFKMGG